jgi:transposase
LHAHQSYAYRCTSCNGHYIAPLPVTVKRGGLVGPRLTGLIGYLKGSGHLSYTTLQSFLDEGLGADLSTGMLAKAVDKVSQALHPVYQPLLESLPYQDRLHIDETGHKDRGQSMWTWVFAAPRFTVFHIAESRSSQVLDDILGNECAAVLGHDYFSSYRAYMKRAPVTVQFCLAHLIRELRFLRESTSKVMANYGQRLLGELKALFRLIYRRGQLRPRRSSSGWRKLVPVFYARHDEPRPGSRGDPGQTLPHSRSRILHLYHASRHRTDQQYRGACFAFLCD